MISVGPPAQGLEHGDVCAVAQLILDIVFQSKEGLTCSKYGKTRGQSQMGILIFFILILIPFKKKSKSQPFSGWRSSFPDL